jgi:acyl-CoA dehydrogenase
MTTSLSFDPVRLPQQCQALRADVRAFLAEEISAGTFDPHHPGHGDS